MTRLAIAVCCYAAIFAVSFCCALALRFDIDPLQFLYFAAGNPIPIPAGAAGRGLFELEQQQFAVDTFRSGLGALILLKVASFCFRVTGAVICDIRRCGIWHGQVVCA